MKAKLRTRVRGAEPGAASRRSPRRGTAAHRRWRRERQDDDPCRARRLADRARHPPRADPPTHVQQAGRSRDGLACGPAGHERHRSRLGRNVPRDREPSPAPPRSCARSHPGLHRPRPGRWRRRDEPPARRTRVLGPRAAVPPQGHARGDLLADGERGRAAHRRAEASLPLVSRRGRGDPRDLPRVHRTQAAAARPRLRRPAAVLEGPRHITRDRVAARRDVRAHPGRRVPGHERAAGRHPRRDAACSRPAQPDGRGRRRPGDLRLPCRDREEHPRVPRALPGRDDDQARAELPFDAADPGGVERGDRAESAATREDPPPHSTGRVAADPAGVSRRGRAERRRVSCGPRAS